MISKATLLLLVFAVSTSTAAPRARDLGIPFDGTPGPNNAITDVKGVEVGHSTILQDDGPKPVRTGVTAVFPLGRKAADGVPAGIFRLNGTGEMTGSHMIEEMGMFFGPVVLTNTWSVGLAMDGVLKWTMARLPRDQWFARSLPVVAETMDIPLNDIFGQHVTTEHVFEALDNARGGAVAEGNVGGGTGMVAFQYKGGIGTASRTFTVNDTRYNVGVLLQANMGKQRELRVAGIPVMPQLPKVQKELGGPKNSLIILVATDAPLSPSQLKRLARRAALGVGRVGSTASSLSGEIFLAFSTGNPVGFGNSPEVTPVSNLDIGVMDALFALTVQATEEALINQLIASEDMTGPPGITMRALPEDALVELLRRHDRLEKPE